MKKTIIALFTLCVSHISLADPTVFGLTIDKTKIEEQKRKNREELERQTYALVNQIQKDDGPKPASQVQPYPAVDPQNHPYERQKEEQRRLLEQSKQDQLKAQREKELQ